MKVNIKEYLNAMSKEEIRLAEDVQHFADRIENPIIKALLTVIALDSQKHANLYLVAVDLLSEQRRLMSDKDLEELEKELKDHIKEESEHYEEVKKMIEKVGDERVKLVLNVILEDEQKHHKIFKKLNEVVMRKEGLTEDLIWDMVWKEAMMPGGG